MKEKLNFVVKENNLTQLQLEKLKKTFGQMDVDVSYSRCEGGFDLSFAWDSSEIYRRSSRYAGRSRIEKPIDWDQVEFWRSLGMQNEEIADRLGYNIRTFYRRQHEYRLPGEKHDHNISIFEEDL